MNRKRVQRLMREMGLAGMAPGPNTSRTHPQHKVYLYLLRGVVVTQPNQVWSTDITYIRLARGFAYLESIQSSGTGLYSYAAQAGPPAKKPAHTPKIGAAPSSCESNRVQLKLGEKLS